MFWGDLRDEKVVYEEIKNFVQILNEIKNLNLKKTLIFYMKILDFFKFFS